MKSARDSLSKLYLLRLRGADLLHSLALPGKLVNWPVIVMQDSRVVLMKPLKKVLWSFVITVLTFSFSLTGLTNSFRGISVHIQSKCRQHCKIGGHTSLTLSRSPGFRGTVLSLGSDLSWTRSGQLQTVHTPHSTLH